LKVVINDDMVEQLTPPDTVDPAERKEILKDLARALKKQGSHILASKKYTQAGDRIRAMKCLVRGGDTKAVIQFASISRSGEIYKLAANYLQQMNWRESVDIMRAIIAFYTKAKSFEQLAGFYDSCAQVRVKCSEGQMTSYTKVSTMFVTIVNRSRLTITGTTRRRSEP
jgi:intraflagellar transport protein 140